MLITIFFIIILFYSIIFHEVAHGYAAYRNGDNTAYNAGRLTLNPLSHIDIIGSIIVPIFSYLLFKLPFGWAKPVPYNPNNISHKKYAELEVASAGILTNIFIGFLAVVIFYVLRYFGLMSSQIQIVLIAITNINLFLACFNLLPFPPADGFSVFSELFSHINSWFLSVRNKFSNKKHYQASYIDNNNGLRNKMFRVKHIFSNPFLMIIVIIFAVNVFNFIVPFILKFINYLYSF